MGIPLLVVPLVLDASRGASVLRSGTSRAAQAAGHGAVVVARTSKVGPSALARGALHGLGLASAKADAAIEALRVGARRRTARERMEGGEPDYRRNATAFCLSRGRPSPAP